MIDGRRVLAVIPARGGSKGVKFKNLRKVAGMPLFRWSWEAARYSRHIDRIVVSTENPDIKGVAKGIGIDVVDRPEELATDEAKIEHVALHALMEVDDGYDYVVILQPTCPLRTTEEIDTCILLCHNWGAASCSTVSLHDEHPMKSLVELPGIGIVPYFGEEYLNAPRQSLPTFYKQTGSVYVCRVAEFMTAGGVAHLEPWVPFISEFQNVDIDTEQDIAIADFLLRRRFYG